MLTKSGIFAVFCAAGVLAVAADAKAQYRNIVLKGFSPANYALLNNGIDQRVCVTGPLQINTAGVYFQLEPLQSGEVISPSFSRILSGLSYAYAAKRRLRDGEVYQVCGDLQDATPWNRCDYDSCKWFKLETSELGAKPSRE